MDKLQKYKPLVWAKVEFGFDREVLYWEGSVEDFQERKNLEYIIFPRHGDRRVPTSKIKDFAQVQPDDREKALEFKMVTLTERQKEDVKLKIASMKTNIGREPTSSEEDRIIQITVNPSILEKEKQAEDNKYNPLTVEQRLKTILMIRRQKVAKIITGSYIGFKK